MMNITARRINKVDLTIDESKEVYIFVYGTLLKGQSNYERYLAPLEPVMRGTIEGFNMFDLGAFPAVIYGDDIVKGEIYKVSWNMLDRIDRLEGEGVLYKKEKVKVKSYEYDEVEAYVYLYLQSVSGCPMIPSEAQPYKNEYVWYVAYGSNMCYERFATYIEGGYYERNGKEYTACADTTLPTETRKVEIHLPMYFANYNMGSWENSAVSFLDVNGFGESYGRAYLIKESQLTHIHTQEGRGANWYPDIVELGEIEGIKALTVTNKNTKRYSPMSEISAAYLSTIMDGLQEMGESAELAFDYVCECTSRMIHVRWTTKDADEEFESRRKIDEETRSKLKKI